MNLLEVFSSFHPSSVQLLLHVSTAESQIMVNRRTVESLLKRIDELHDSFKTRLVF